MSEIITLDNIAGYYEEKEEVKKIIDVINNYEEYKQKGVYIPKGIILQGPPGTGKTLFAKAIANATNCSFYQLTYSDVSNALSNLKELFEEAKKNLPSIIYIDEIDRIVSENRHRAGSDSNQNCISYLLTQLDGINSSNDLLVIASTNQYRNLPESLLRSGRMDKKLIIDYPSKRDIEEILKLYFKDKPLFDKINIKVLAIRLRGMTGADIKTMVNNTMIDFIGKKEYVEIDDFTNILNAMHFETIGKRFIGEKVKRKVLAHEFGHAIVGYVLEGTAGSISAIKYGDVLGHNDICDTIVDVDTLLEDVDYEEDQEYLASFNKISYKKLWARLLGGMAAEQVYLGYYDVGCSSDLLQFRDTFVDAIRVGYFSRLYVLDDYSCSQKNWKLTKEFKKVFNKAERTAKKIINKYKYLGRFIIDEAVENGDTLNDAQFRDCVEYYKANKKEIERKYKAYKL